MTTIISGKSVEDELTELEVKMTELNIELEETQVGRLANESTINQMFVSNMNDNSPKFLGAVKQINKLIINSRNTEAKLEAEINSLQTKIDEAVERLES